MSWNNRKGEAMIYEIVSGKRQGEMYHWKKYVALTKEKADEALANIEATYAKEIASDDWLWGPHIIERPNFQPKDILEWDGHQEVPAKIWEYCHANTTY